MTWKSEGFFKNSFLRKARKGAPLLCPERKGSESKQLRKSLYPQGRWDWEGQRRIKLCVTPNTFHFCRIQSLRLSLKLRIDSLELSESSYNSLPLILLVKTVVIYNINSFSLERISSMGCFKKKNGLISQDREKFEQLPEEVNHLFWLVENC